MEKDNALNVVASVDSSQDLRSEPPQPAPSLIALLKEHRKVVLTCLGMTTAVFLWGYDSSIVGSAAGIPAFQRDFGKRYRNKYIIPSTWLALWNAFSPIGHMTGAAIAGRLQDRIGRRWSVIIGSIISALAVFVMFVSNEPASIASRRGMFLAAKYIQGAGIGMVSCSAQTYMSEILPPLLRGPGQAFIPIFILIGQLVGAIVIYVCIEIESVWAYRIPFSIQWVTSIGAIVFTLFAPESPTWLVRMDRLDAAVKNQSRLERHPENSQTHIDALQRAITLEKEEKEGGPKATYIDCFRGIDRRRTLIIIFANMLPNIWGLPMLSKASYYLQIVGMKAKTSLVILIIGIILGLFANIGSMWTLRRFGRRQLILFTMGFITLVWVTQGIGGIWHTQGSINYTAASMMIIVVTAGLGVWPASYVVAGETSSLHLRGASQGIGWFSQGLTGVIWSLFLPYIYNPDAGNLGAKTGFVVAGLVAVGMGVAWLVIPELKDRDQVTIDKLFLEKVPARHSKQYANPPM